MESVKTRVGKLVDLIAYRRDRFGLVSDVFSRESSEETIAQMISLAREDNDELDESIELALRDRLRSLEADNLPAFATKTRTEYARLFLGPREVVAPLHESAWLSGTVRTFTAETLAVRVLYERYGYVMRAKNTEPDDGIGVEFEFLRNLCADCLLLINGSLSSSEVANKVDRLLRAQEEFEEQHLIRWAYRFAQRVVDNDRSGYYAAWATYLAGVLSEDKALLDDCRRIIGDAARSL